MPPVPNPYVAAGGDVLSSLIGGFTSMYNANKANALSYRMFKEGNEFSAQQAAQNRAFQKSERLATEKYNSPLNQRAMLAAAGLPVTDSKGSSVTPMSSQPMSGSAAQSGATPSVSVAQPFDMSNVVATALSAASTASQIRRSGIMSQVDLEKLNLDKQQYQLNKNADERAQDLHQSAMDLASAQVDSAREDVYMKRWQNKIAPQIEADRHNMSEAQIQHMSDMIATQMVSIQKQYESALYAANMGFKGAKLGADVQAWCKSVDYELGIFAQNLQKQFHGDELKLAEKQFKQAVLEWRQEFEQKLTEFKWSKHAFKITKISDFFSKLSKPLELFTIGKFLK